MTELCEPLVPAEVDLRDFQFMPLQIERVQRSRMWLRCKRKPELAFYLLNLMMASWHGSPAGSLEDDDETLSHLSMCDIRRFSRIKGDLLFEWVKCTDGRLYHPLVAELAIEAWKSKQSHARRGALGAAKRWQKHSSANGQAIAGDAKGEGEGQGDSSEDKSSAAVRQNGPDDPVTAVFDAGLRVLTRRGVTEQRARGLIGKYRKEIGDDGRLLAIVLSVERENPVDPVGYLTKACERAARGGITPMHPGAGG